jgi:outer membrane protein
MKQLLIVLISFFTLLNVSQAQKFGYVNSQQLLSEMPDLKSAESQLKAFQDPMIATGKGMVTSLETEYNKYMEDVNKGLLSNVERQQKEQEIQTKQQNIQKYEMEIQQKIVAKRELVYKPIIDKINAAIKKYGETKGYTMIFDSSVGGLLHASDADDVLAGIKAQMGI